MNEVAAQAQANLDGGYPDYQLRPRHTIEELIAEIERLEHVILILKYIKEPTHGDDTATRRAQLN